MSKLYQDAILDAKALRASAMANAKAALEEAFEPKIQEMLRLKLSEELDEEMPDEAEVDQDIANMEETYSEDGMGENLDINEAELEEILAELEELSKVDDGYEPEMEEAMHDKMKDENLNEAEEDEEEEAEEEEEEEEVEGEEEFGDDTKIIDITLGDLKQVLQSVMAGSQDMGMDIPSDEADPEAEAEAEISLDEILAELEKEGAEDVDSTGYEAGHQIPENGLEEKKKHDKEKVEDELEEANSTIEELRHSLQEVNLLNAKYLYMNKLFKSKTLTESQKVKVINALDRATSVTEVKNTFETLKESFESKKQLKESIGFASQAAGVAPKQPIIEQDNMMSRWQKLAGIK
jgi:hypothetical protein